MLLKTTRRKIPWLSTLLIAAILLAACGQAPAITPTPFIEPTATPEPGPPVPVVPVEGLYNTHWELIGYGDAADPTVVSRDVKITAEFTPDGIMSGSSGCNSYNAMYNATLEGALTVVPPIATTRMACERGMEAEATYLAALESAQSFSFTPEGWLEIVYDSNPAYEEKLVYTSGEVSFTNTTWVLVASGDPGTPAKLTPGVVITAIFAPDGVLSGFSGCNTYATSYTASEGQLTVNPPAATMMACPSGMEEEAAYLDALSKAESYEVVGSRLTIRADQGSSVLVYTSANLPLQNTLWSLVDFAGNPTPEGVEITAVFLPEGADVPATVGGSAGCNNYNAGFTLDWQNITIGPAATTMMFCEGAMETETAYLAALQAAQTYQILANTLTLETISGTLTYAADRTPLTGALWVLSGMGDPANLQAPVEGAYFTAQFTRTPGAPSGVMTGSTGCNEYSAAYTANLQQIKINLPNKSKNPCSDALLEQEQAYFLALNNARSYKILGSTLYIPYDDGRQELVYTATQVQTQPVKPLSDLDGSYWFLHALGDKPTLPGITVTASFAINPDGYSGSLSGSAGCNSYAASFGDNLGVTTSLTSGERCSKPAGVMEQESAYLQALSRAFGYWITGDQLIINSSLSALTYRQTAPVSSMDESHLLQGINWYLVSINTAPVVAGSGVANVFFDPNGTLRGFSGCNSMSGSYATNLEQISISQVSSTKTACPDAASSAQETAFLNGLNSARTYQVAGSAMQIVAQSGVLNFSTQQPDVPPTPIPATAVISGPAQGMVGQTLTFDASASTSASPIVKYSWDFGDGGRASGVVAQHVYTQPGSFRVTMTVQNQTGFQNTATVAIAIQAQPQPDQPPSAAVDGPSEGFVAEAVSFSAAATQPGTNPIASFAWNFGNGVTAQPSADPNASAIYDQPGVYQVTVVVMDTKGLSSSAQLEITINSRPQTGEWILGDALPGTSITLAFGQGQFSGFAGCNSYSGSYSASDNGDGTYSISASGVVSTGAMCSEEVMAQEAAYLAALQTVSLASIQGNVLQLSHANGTLVYYLAGTPQPR